MNLVIEAASTNDIDMIASFQEAMAFETEGIKLDPVLCRAGVSGVFTGGGKGSYFLAKSGDKMVASLLVQKEWSDWRNGEVWWIHSVYVVPEWRRQRIFSKMYEFLKMTGLKDPLFRGLRLFVEKNNQRAQAVYRSLGMNNDHYELFEWMVDF